MFSGYKNYIFAALLSVLGVTKVVTDIDVIESITVLGVSDPATLITTGIAWALGRDALSKIR